MRAVLLSRGIHLTIRGKRLKGKWSVMRKRLLLVLILMAGAYLRLHNLDWGLPEVFEEATPWRQAWEMWEFESGRLDFNPHFFHYPAFSFYIQWLGQALVYLVGRVSGAFSSPQHMLTAFTASPYRFFVVGRLITSLFGIGSIYLIYRLGKDVSSPAVGLLAASFLAFNAPHISRGQLINTDIPLVFFILLAFVPILKIAAQGKRRHYIWAGVCVGLATGVKYPGLLTGAGIVAAHVFHHLTRKRTWRQTILSSSLWSSAGVAVLTFFAVSPYCFIDYSGFYRDFRFEQTHMAIGHFGTPDRLVSYGKYLFSIIPGILTLPVLGLTLAGIGYGIRKDRYFSMMLLAFPLVYFAVVGSWKMAADHYILPVIPFLLLYAALALWKIFDRPGIPRRGLLTGLAACLFLIPSLLQIREHNVRPPMEDNRTLARLWIEENIEKGAAIAKEQYTPDLSAEDYLVFELPLSTIYPGETGPFYDLRWYRDFDYMITSSEVYRRYMRKPEDYPVHVRFYEELDESASLVKRFDETTGSGPHLSIYRLGGQAGATPADGVPPELYQELIDSSDPEANAGLLCNLAIVLSRKGDYARAVEIYRLAIAVDSASTRAWHNLALTLGSMGRTRESESAFKQAVLIDSTYSKSWFGLGHLYRQTGDLALSLDAYERGLRYAPYRLDILRILSEEYLRAGRTDDALKVAERGLEISRGAHEFQFAVGCIQMVMGDHEDAIKSLGAAVESSPSNGRYAYSLAGAYYSNGDYDRAMQYALRAQELGYDAKDLIETIEATLPSDRQ